MDGMETSMTKIKYTKEGNISSINANHARTILKMLLKRNDDPCSPDFGILTQVEFRALYALIHGHINAGESE